ncbi:hypothetical protein QBC32DRAFT_343309 [Pseudoneurospora amorphoporcata]|uniref:Uncharacterized protein n=1 Tax=Pseudoneurospora amorphoporcata TaxID=241081 RepID=A0AAN6SFF5_9PEZI|nr:hypothetical protein QBC32DRAFT_343309 [Pseudoneurospora amorphoporcata]
MLLFLGTGLPFSTFVHTLKIRRDNVTAMKPRRSRSEIQTLKTQKRSHLNRLPKFDCDTLYNFSSIAHNNLAKTNVLLSLVSPK